MGYRFHIRKKAESVPFSMDINPTPKGNRQEKKNKRIRTKSKVFHGTFPQVT